MKKRIFTFFLLSLLLVCLAACSIPYDEPYGKWQSIEPKLMIDINPNKEGYYSGVYERNGEAVAVFIAFAHEKAFVIQDYQDMGETAIKGDNPYFNGLFEVKKDGKLYYTLKPYWEEKTGYKTIVFEKIESYEVP